MSKKLFRKSGSGKVRDWECPYLSHRDEAVDLTASQYAKADRCLCAHCWFKRPDYRQVLSYEWIGEPQ